METIIFTEEELLRQQDYILDLVDKGKRIIIRRNKKQAYRIVTIDKAETTNQSLGIRLNID